MIIEFCATIFREGSFKLEPDELDEADQAGIDLGDKGAVAEYFREKWRDDGCLNDIVCDEWKHQEIDITEWGAR